MGNDSVDVLRNDSQLNATPPHNASISTEAAFVKSDLNYGTESSGFSQGCAGFVAGLSNMIVTFPLNKIMLRQQMYGHFTSKAIRQMKHEGLFYLYRGLGPILVQKTISTTIMFGAYGEFKSRLEQNTTIRNASTCQTRIMLAGALSGSVESFLTPFERIQALLIDSKRHIQFKNTLDAFNYVKEMGIKELYRGYTCILLRDSVLSSLWFSSRYVTKQKTAENNTIKKLQQTKSGELFVDFCTGSFIGASISTVFFPLSVAKMCMMSQIGHPYLSVYQAMKLAYTERGSNVLRLYTGALINFPRALLGWGIVNAVYEFTLQHFFTTR